MRRLARGESLEETGCPGLPPVLRRIRHAKMGHRVQARMADGQTFYVCIVCGAWAQYRVVRMKRPCRGPPGPKEFGHTILSRIATDHHPLRPSSHEGPVTRTVARDIMELEPEITRGCQGTSDVIRRPSEGGYLDRVINKIKARL